MRGKFKYPSPLYPLMHLQIHNGFFPKEKKVDNLSFLGNTGHLDNLQYFFNNQTIFIYLDRKGGIKY